MSLMDLTAVELGKRIKNGEVSVAEAAKDAIARINKMEPAVNSYVTVLEEERVLKRAQEVQQGIAEGKYTSPLAGVPVAIKDNMCTKEQLAALRFWRILFQRILLRRYVI